MASNTEHTPIQPRRRLLVVAAGNEAKVVLEMFGVVVALEGSQARGLGLQRSPGFPGTPLPPHALTSWSLIEMQGVDLLITGVGKANATGAVMAAAAARSYSSIVNIGIGGALPRTPAPIAIGQVVLGTVAHFADEGVQTPGGFLPLAQVGFACGLEGSDAVKPDSTLVEELEACADTRGGIATVSVCSGTDELAREVAQRTGAIAEGMEGAGVLLASARLGIPAAELRVISNTTGDRTRQVWDMKAAMKRLATLAVSLS